MSISNFHPPERGDPFRPVVAPDHEALSRLETGGHQPTGKRLRHRSQLVARVRPSPEAIVEEERAAAAADVPIEEVERAPPGKGVNKP